MGSYVRNCFISNQILPSGSQLVVIPITQAKGYSPVKLVSPKDPTKKFEGRQACHSVCYPNAFWEPVGVYIEAKGDDSYAVEPLDTAFNRRSMMIFFKEVYSRAFDVEAETERDDPLKMSDFFEEHAPAIKALIIKTANIDNRDFAAIDTLPWHEFSTLWEELAEKIEDQQVFLSDYHGLPSVLQFSTCSKASYNYVLSHTAEHNLFMNHAFENEMKRLRENDEYSIKNRKYANIFTIIHDVFKFEGGSQARHKYSDCLEEIVSEYDWDNKDNYTEENFRAIKPRFKLAEDFMVFQFNLDDFNLQFHPTHGSSQDYSNEAGKNYSQLVSHTHQVIRDYLKADGFFEDEDEE